MAVGTDCIASCCRCLVTRIDQASESLALSSFLYYLFHILASCDFLLHFTFVLPTLLPVIPVTALLSIPLAFIVLYSTLYFHAMSCCDPQSLRPQIEDGIEMDVLCKKCHAPKPPRTHHCSTCGMCIDRMDHHCPWINCCVGRKNNASFFNMIVWCCIGKATVALCTYRALQILKHGYSSTWRFSIVFYSCIFAIAFTVALFLFLAWNAYLISSNLTSLDVLMGSPPYAGSGWAEVFGSLSVASFFPPMSHRKPLH